MGSRSKRLRIWMFVLVQAVLVGACRNRESVPSGAAVMSTASHDEAACRAARELAALDPRETVPLQPMMAWHQKQNMMDHPVAIQQITDALVREDWDGVARASAMIETSPEMERMCEHMGAGAAGFTETALDFHRRADQIGEAARLRDREAVLRATAHTLEACTGCHARFRQEIVDAAAWQARTGTRHDSGASHTAH